MTNYWQKINKLGAERVNPTLRVLRLWHRHDGGCCRNTLSVPVWRDPPPLSVRTHTASTATKLINSQIVLNFNSIKSGLQLWDFLSCDTKLTGCFQVPAWYTIWHLKIILGPHTGVNTYIIRWITVIACVGKSHQKDTVTSHQHNNHTHSSYCEKLLWKKL